MNPEAEPRTSAGWIPLAALLTVTVAAFWPSLDGEFVFDDHRFVPENRAIRDLGNAPRFFTDVATMTSVQGIPGWNDIYRPLRTLSYAVDHALLGGSPLGFRVVNLLWHLLAVVLAWLLLRRLLGDPRLATLGAGVFALHPLQAQSVAWISSRGDLMAAVFVLGAALGLLREDANRRTLMGGVALYVLALFSKESAIGLLAIVPFHDRLLPRPEPRMRWRLYGAMGLVTLLFLLIRFEMAVAQTPFESERLLDVGSGLVILLGGVLVPMGLAPFTGDILHDRLTIATGGLVLAAAAVVVGLALVRGRRAPLPAFALLFVAATLAPVSGLVPLKSLAESRFAYLPLFGVGLGLALLARKLGARGLALGAATVVLLAAWTFREARVWADDLVLWEAGVARQSRAFGEAGPVALANLGHALSERGRHEEAVEFYRRSLARHETPINWAKLSMEHFDAGQPGLALEAGQRAIRMGPDSLAARDTVGTVLLRMGRFREAEEHLRIAVGLAPDLGPVRRRWGRALLQCGRIPEALHQLRMVVRRTPWHMGARVLLGKGLAASGSIDEARETFEAAARLEGATAEPLVCLGRLELDAGRPEEALRWLTRALAEDPGHPMVRAERIAAIAARDGTIDPTLLGELVAAIEELAGGRDLAAIDTVLSRPGVRRLGNPDLEHHHAWALLYMGELVRAQEELAAMARRRPDDLLIQANLGLLALRRNRPGEAIAPLERARAGDPESHMLRMALARAYRGAGREPDAARIAGEALRRASTAEQKAEADRFLEGGE